MYNGNIMRMDTKFDVDECRFGSYLGVRRGYQAFDP